jgi:hypothetical protein
LVGATVALNEKGALPAAVVACVPKAGIAGAMVPRLANAGPLGADVAGVMPNADALVPETPKAGAGVLLPKAALDCAPKAPSNMDPDEPNRGAAPAAVVAAPVPPKVTAGKGSAGLGALKLIVAGVSEGFVAWNMKPDADVPAAPKGANGFVVSGAALELGVESGGWPKTKSPDVALVDAPAAAEDCAAELDALAVEKAKDGNRLGFAGASWGGRVKVLALLAALSAPSPLLSTGFVSIFVADGPAENRPPKPEELGAATEGAELTPPNRAAAGPVPNTGGIDGFSASPSVGPLFRAFRKPISPLSATGSASFCSACFSMPFA